MNAPASDPHIILTLAIVFGFLIVFPAFWCFVVWLISIIGGWNRLSQHYAAGSKTLEGEKRSGVSGRIGGLANYNGVLTVRIAADGFFLEVFPLFRPGHPRLFIPWHEIKQRRLKQLFWLRYTEMVVGKPKVATISLALPEELFARSEFATDARAI